MPKFYKAFINNGFSFLIFRTPAFIMKTKHITFLITNIRRRRFLCIGVR